MDGRLDGLTVMDEVEARPDGRIVLRVAFTEFALRTAVHCLVGTDPDEDEPQYLDEFEDHHAGTSWVN